MRIDLYTRIVLTAIALLLATIAFRPVIYPAHAAAQSTSQELYVEPGVYMLRAPDGMKQQLGKVVVDLHTGNIWGFPTASDTPYPIKVNGSNPPTSTPFLLGQFDFDAMHR